MIKRKKFFSNTIMLYIMALAQNLLPMLTFPYLTRKLEPDLYAVITYMTAVISYVRVFLKFGFELSSTKQIAESRNDKEVIGKILGTTIQSNMLLAIISLFVYSAMILSIDIMRNYILLSYLYLIGVYLEIFLPDFLFMGLEKMQSITMRFIVTKVFTTVMTFVLVRTKADILWIPILNIMGNILAVILVWIQIFTKLKLKVAFSTFKDCIQMLRSSSVYFLSKFATTAFGVTNTFMMGIVNLPPEQISFWGVSYNLINSALSLYSPIVNSLYPHMVKKKDQRLIKQILLIMEPVIVAVTIITFLFSSQIITVFCGSKYTGAIPVFRTLLPVLIFAFPAQIIGFPVLGTIGMVNETTKSTIISSIFHVTGLILLIIFGRFTIINIAALRCCTEAMLFCIRGYYLYTYRRTIKNFRGSYGKTN